MGELRKITVHVSEEELQRAQLLTGQGVSETVREGLKRLSQLLAQREFRKLRGTLKFSVELDELREDRSFPPFEPTNE